MLSDHAVLPILLSRDLDATRAFYHDTLGLEIVREDEGDRIVFRCGAGTQLVVTLSTVGTSDTQTRWPGACRTCGRPSRPPSPRRPDRGIRSAGPGHDRRHRRHGHRGPPGSSTRAGTSWQSCSQGLNAVLRDPWPASLGA